MNKTFLLKSLSRFPQHGNEDTLTFTPGVNLIVGLPNTGKTKWLRMLDYLMGDTGLPEDAFGDDLVSKYDSLQALIEIGGEEFEIERNWKEKGAKQKTYINGQGLASSEFSQFILQKLNIPVLHFPKGNPYAERSWPEISWRMMLRQIYRQERFWSEIADKQPESEQHACLLQFLGLAQYVFPQQLGIMVDKRKELYTLQARKEEFQNIFQKISKELVADSSISVFPTEDSIDKRIQELELEITKYEEKKQSIFEMVVQSNKAKEIPIIIELGEKRTALSIERDNILNIVKQSEKRYDELSAYHRTLKIELEKLSRTLTAGISLADIQVTHCPACDREITRQNSSLGRCYVCGQPEKLEYGTASNAKSRIEFEVEQLEEEISEIDQLINKLAEENEESIYQVRQIDSQLQTLEEQIQLTRMSISSVVPTEVPLIDNQIGRIQERIQQLKRLKNTLQLRNKLSKDIEKLENHIKSLENETDTLGEKLSLQDFNDILSDGMNTYLNILKKGDDNRWPEDAVSVEIKEKGFSINVGKGKWQSKLGATLKCYFLLSYHYSLMLLSRRDGCHYPGFGIVDFPPTLADGAVIADKENFLIEPFIDLINNNLSRCGQLIVTGNSFVKVEGANRIELKKVYK